MGFFVLIFLGRCARAERAAERHSGPAGRVDLRGAARLEAASEDRLHRWPAQRLRGPAAELVSRPLHPISSSLIASFFTSSSA